MKKTLTEDGSAPLVTKNISQGRCILNNTTTIIKA